MSGNGWYDEWRVTGTHPSGERFERTWDSRDPRWPDRLAESAARAFITRAEAGPIPWEDGPYMLRARVYRGTWQQVLPRPPAEPGRPRTPISPSRGRRKGSRAG